MAVFVLDKSGKPLMPCSEKRARLLLERERARIHRVLPFVIRLIDRKAGECAFQPLRIKLDPGSKITGIALVMEKKEAIAVLNLFDLVHRGHQISKALTSRRQLRRGHRTRSLRYRAPRFLNRGNKGQGWLAPSLMHRVHTTLSWVKRFQRWAPVSVLSTELVRFDMQLMQNPEISGVEYQQGELQGYEVREYQRTRVTAQGFPRGYLMRQKQVHGFQTGDLIKAAVPAGKKVGTHVGRVAVRASGSFNIQTSQGVIQGIAHRHCTVIQRGDGYGYSTKGLQSSTALLSSPA